MKNVVPIYEHKLINKMNFIILKIMIFYHKKCGIYSHSDAMAREVPPSTSPKKASFI